MNLMQSNLFAASCALTVCHISARLRVHNRRAPPSARKDGSEGIVPWPDDGEIKAILIPQNDPSNKFTIKGPRIDAYE